MKKILTKLFRQRLKALMLVVMTGFMALSASAQSITINDNTAGPNYPYQDYAVDYTAADYPTGTTYYLVLDENGNGFLDSDDYVLGSSTTAAVEITGELPNDPGNYDVYVIAGDDGDLGAYLGATVIPNTDLITIGGTLNGDFPFTMDQAALRELITTDYDLSSGSFYTMVFDLDATAVTATNPIVIEYSINGGVDFTTLADIYDLEEFEGSNGQILVPLPEATYEPAVRFRISQNNSAGLLAAEESWILNSAEVRESEGSFVQYDAELAVNMNISNPTFDFTNDVAADTVGEDFSADYEALGFTTGAVFYFYTGDILDSTDRVIYDQSTTATGTFEGTFPLQDEATIDQQVNVAAIYGNIDRPEINFEASGLTVTGTDESDFVYEFDQDGTRSMRTNTVDISEESVVFLIVDFSYSNFLSSDDGLRIQYSTNGSTWIDIDSLEDDSFFGEYSFEVPSEAFTSSTAFRVRQKSFDNGANDVWAIEELRLDLYNEAYNQIYVTYSLSNYSLAINNVFDADGANIFNGTDVYPGDSITLEVEAHGFAAESEDYAVLINGQYFLDIEDTDIDTDTDIITIAGNIPADIEYGNGVDLEVIIYNGAEPLVGINEDIFNDYEEDELIITTGDYNGSYVDFEEAGERSITTPEFEIASEDGLVLSFFLQRLNSVRSPEGTEVVLEYSTDGTTYTEIAQFSLNDAGTGGDTYSVTDMDGGVANMSTTFRFRQASNNGNGLDTWRIQNISLEGATNFFTPDYLDYTGSIAIDVLEPVITLASIDDGGADLYPGTEFTVDFEIPNGMFPAGTEFTLYADRDLSPIILGTEEAPEEGMAATFTVSVPSVVPGNYDLYVAASFGEVESNTSVLSVIGIQINNISITSEDALVDGSSEIIYPGSTVDIAYTVVGSLGNDVTATLEVYDNDEDTYVSLASNEDPDGTISAVLPLGLDYDGDPEFRLSLINGNLETFVQNVDRTWNNDDSGTGSAEYFPIADREGYYGSNNFFTSATTRSATSIPFDFSEVSTAAVSFAINVNSFSFNQDIFLQYSVDEGETWVELAQAEITQTGTGDEIFEEYVELPMVALTEATYIRFIYNEDGAALFPENYITLSGFYLQTIELTPIATADFDLSDSDISLELLSVSVSDMDEPSFRAGEEFVVEYNADGPFPTDVTFAVVMEQGGEYIVLGESDDTGAVQVPVTFPAVLFGNTSNPYNLSVEPYVKADEDDEYRPATIETDVNEEEDFLVFEGGEEYNDFDEFYFDQAGDRSLLTRAFDLTATDTVELEFYFEYYGGTPSTLLVLPQLQVSIDGGATFEVLSVEGSGYEEEGYLYNTGTFTVPIPAEYLTEATQFRWVQALNRGDDENDWWIENIVIREGDSNEFGEENYVRGPNNDPSQDIYALLPDFADYEWSQNDLTDAVFNGEEFEYLFTIDSATLEEATFPEGTVFIFTLQGETDPDTNEDVVIATTTEYGVGTASIPFYVENGNYNVYAQAVLTVEDEDGVEEEVILDEQTIASLDIFLRAIRTNYEGDELATLYAGSTATFSISIENDETNAGTYDDLFANLIVNDGGNDWLLATQQGIADIIVDLPPFVSGNRAVRVELSEEGPLGEVGSILEDDLLDNLENDEDNFIAGDVDEFDEVTFAGSTGRRFITTRDFEAGELENTTLLSFDAYFEGDYVLEDLLESHQVIFEYSIDGGATFTEIEVLPIAEDIEEGDDEWDELLTMEVTDEMKSNNVRFRWRQEEASGYFEIWNIQFLYEESLPFDYIPVNVDISEQALLISSIASEEACFDGDITLNYEIRGRFGADNEVYVYYEGDEVSGAYLSQTFNLTEGTNSITFKLPSDVLEGGDDNDAVKFYLEADDQTNEDEGYSVVGPWSEQSVELVAPIDEDVSFSFSNPLECDLTEDILVSISGEQDYFMYEILNDADGSVLGSIVYDPEEGDDEINIGAITSDMVLGIRVTSMTSASTVCNTFTSAETEDLEVQSSYKLFRRGYNNSGVRVEVAAGDTRTVCSGASDVYLSANRTSETGDLSGGNIEWFRDDLSNPVTIIGTLLGDNETLVTGNYFARITDGSCSYLTESFALIITETPERPVVSIESGDLSFCDGEGEVVLSAPEGFAYYKWNSDQNLTGRMLTVDTQGSYYVQVSNVPFDAGCGSATSIPVVVESQYLPDFQVKTTTSSDDQYNIIDGSTHYGCDGFYIYFYNGDSYQNNNGEVVISRDGVFYASTQNVYYELTESGEYTVDWVSSDLNSSCSASIGSFTLEITDRPEETPVITAGGPLSFCEGGSVTLTATAGFTYYRWYRNGSILSNNSATLTVRQSSGRYQVEASNVPFNVGCYSERSAGINVTVHNDPDMELYSNYWGNFADGDIMEVCSSSEDLYLRSYNSGGLPVIWYLDGVAIEGDDQNSGSSAYSYVYPEASGAYHAEITLGDANNACVFTTPVVNVVYSAQPDAVAIAVPANTEFCANDINVTLTADAGASLYRWYRDGSAITDGLGSSNTLTVTRGGDYTVTVAEAEGCESERSNIITITERTLPSTSISVSTFDSDCATGDVTLAVFSTNAEYSYQLLNRETGEAVGAEFTGGPSTLYVDLTGLTEAIPLMAEISYADGSGCVAMNKSVGTASPDGVMLELDGNTLTAVISGNYLEYTWYRNDVKMRNASGTSITVTDAATYSIEVVFVGGCVATSNAIDLSTGDGRATASASNGRIVANTYPNPSSSSVNIDVPGDNMGVYKVQIMTLSGQVVISGEFAKDQAEHIEQIDISHLDRGIYNMMVVKGKQVENIRIVKQ